MKFFIVGRSLMSKAAMRKTLKRIGCDYGERNPDIVVSLGGDGTFLISERRYPGIPKLLIRDSNICKKCNNLEFDELFMKIMLNNFTTTSYNKIEATFRRKKYLAINDFVVRNKMPTHAIRFSVEVNEKIESCIGDGVVISTVFGSTGYHYSITKKKFNKGIGMAFNNITKVAKHRIVNENTIIKIKLLRHDAHFAVDNQKKVHTIKEGETVTIRGSKKTAQIVKVI